MTHKPVLVNEVVSFLSPQKGKNPDKSGIQARLILVDCTFGAGGHTDALLKKSEGNTSSNGIKLYAIDIDSEELRAKSLEYRIKEKEVASLSEVKFIQGNFRNLSELVPEKVDGVLFDLGISSVQLEDGERGFSYRHNGPLDMRMNRESGAPCFKLIEKFKVDDMEFILKRYGEERWSRKIARNICEKRPRTTEELYEIVLSAIPFKYSKETRTLQASSETGRVLARIFQALRIYINDELENLRIGLKEAFKILNKNGRICVISYNSLEDRIVKNFFRFNENLEELTKKPVYPTATEIFNNHRARSAKLRCAEKVRD